MFTTHRRPQPGSLLKARRISMGLTVRDVQERSETIAGVEGTRRFYVSHSSLSSIESNKIIPTIYKLFTLSAIYRIPHRQLLLSYGIDLDQISKFEIDLKLPGTHLVPHELSDPNRPVNLPVKLDPGFALEKTSLLSRMVEAWGEIPIGFFQHLRTHEYLYGFIGMEDYTLFPLIRPGSFVQIDERDREIQSSRWENEFHRPIYFLELRGGYAYGWCQLEGRTLSIIPYSASRIPIRRLQYPQEVEAVGRVTGVAMSLVPSPRESSQRLSAQRSRKPDVHDAADPLIEFR